MGYLSRIHQSMTKTSLYHFRDFMSQYDAMSTFYFSNAAIDEGEKVLYAIFRTGPHKDPRHFLPLTSDDLISLIAECSTFLEDVEKNGGNPNPFYPKLASELDRALIELGAHESTLEYLQNRNAQSPAVGTRALYHNSSL